jgi:hypothetical protein
MLLGTLHSDCALFLYLQVLSTGVPEICNYPFTTRSIKVGHFYLDGRKHQVRNGARSKRLHLGEEVANRTVDPGQSRKGPRIMWPALQYP